MGLERSIKDRMRHCLTRLLVLTCTAALWGQADSDAEFAAKVEPILKQRCLGCHNEKSRSSGFSVATREQVLQGGARHGQAVRPGRVDESIIIKSLRGELSPRMPLGGEPLPESSIQSIANWIGRLKADSPETSKKRPWAFEPPAKIEPPSVTNAAWPKNGVDAFILRKLEEKKLTPAPEASRQVLLRRAYFDLIGLPPSPTEAVEFLDDKSPDAWEKLIDRLLADPRYGERWGRYWLDLARYADTAGFEGDLERPHMWRYRDYVIDAFNKDKAFNQFVREQLAGDEMDGTPPEARIAVGFLRLGPWFAGGIGENSRQNLLNEMTASVGSVFLGLTVKCAQCHDHKYDPIPQKDYYRLQAFFMPIQLRESESAFSGSLAAEMKERQEAGRRDLEMVEKEFATYEQSLYDKLPSLVAKEGVQPSRSELRRRLVRDDAATLSASKLPGFSEEEKERYLDLLDRMENFRKASLVRDYGWMRRRVSRYSPVIHTVGNYQPDPSSPGIPTAHIRIRGDFNQIGERVEPGVLSAVTLNQEPSILPMDRSGNVRKWRTVLADWVSSPENPLTARVYVNRIWQYHFGDAILATPSDFGKNGLPPSHPELLDWLATQFVEKKWSTKAMHRLIMSSATYRQTSSHTSKQAEQIDPANQFYWRMKARRLEGEAIRDSILIASGRLNPKRGGPGVFPALPDGLAGLKIKNRTAWDTSPEEETRRRSIYVFQKRHLPDPFLNVMDATVPHDSCARRNVSTTPLQALSLLNGSLVASEATHFADRLAAEGGSDHDQRIKMGFKIAFARLPSPEELTKAKEFIAANGRAGWESFCRVLLNSNEFVYVE